MKIGDITATLAKKAVVNVIYKEWLHEGHIDIEHTEDFRCVIDGKLYEITVREVGNDIGTDYEAYKIALTALRPVSREQVEKMRGKWIDARYSSKDVPQCQCSICGKKYIGLETDFCQYCGAPMTDKAVDMVMERLEEALKDGN